MNSWLQNFAKVVLIISSSGVGTGALPPNVYRGGMDPLQTLENYNNHYPAI